MLNRWRSVPFAAAVVALLPGALPAIQEQTTRVQGTVKREDGSAVSTAAVVLVPAGAATPARPTAHCAVAQNGVFAFTVPNGQYRIVVVTIESVDGCRNQDAVRGVTGPGLPIAAEGRPVTTDFTVATDPTLRMVGARTSGTVVVSSEPGRGLPPGAPRPPGRVGAPPGVPPRATAPGIVSGRITDERGAPVAGVAVQIARRSSTNPTGSLNPYSQAVTDADGRYRVLDVPPAADILVIALALRAEPRTLDEPVPAVPATTEPDGRRIGPLTTYYPGVLTAATAKPIVVGTDEVVGIDFVMRRGPVTTVTIRVAGTMGLRGGFAVLRPDAPIEQIGGRNVRRRAAAPEIVFDDVPAGAHTFSVQTDDGWVNTPIVVRATQPAMTVDVTPLPYLSVSGRVTLDATRVPSGPEALRQIQVELRVTPLTIGAPMYRVPVTADGTFSFPRVAGGRYTLTVASPTFWMPISGTMGGRDTLDFPIDLTDSVTGAALVLADRETAIRGVVRQLDGEAVAGARVVVYSTDSQYWIANASRRVRVLSSGPGGVFSMSNLPPGEYLAAAFPAGTAINNARLNAARATATKFTLAIGESRVADLLLTQGVQGQ